MARFIDGTSKTMLSRGDGSFERRMADMAESFVNRRVLLPTLNECSSDNF